jgi:hypothetical protein
MRLVHACLPLVWLMSDTLDKYIFEPAHYRKAEPSVMGSVGAFWGSVEPHGGFVGIRKQPQNCIQDDVFHA